MSFLIFAGCVAFITGVMLILFPKALTAIGRWLNKTAGDIDRATLRYRTGIGISLILTAACLWFIAYYMKVIPLLRRLG